MSQRLDVKGKSWELGKVAGVSAKDLITFPEGTAKLIRLEPGAHYPLHKHPHRTEYVYVLEGEPTLSVGDEVHVCHSGDFVSFPESTPHALANESQNDAILFVGAIYHAEAKA